MTRRRLDQSQWQDSTSSASCGGSHATPTQQAQASADFRGMSVPVQAKSAQDEMVQAKEGGSDVDVHALAKEGTSGGGGGLPHLDVIQQAFGGHDLSGVSAHSDGAAQDSAAAMGAKAYATGDNIVLGSGVGLHTVAHEAAHVVQQRQGVNLQGGVGKQGDAYERQADAVADRVVRGQSAEDLLGSATRTTETHGAVQHQKKKGDGGGRRMSEGSTEVAARMYMGESESQAIQTVRASKDHFFGLISSWEPSLSMEEIRQVVENLKKHLEDTETDAESMYRMAADGFEMAATAADRGKYASAAVTATSLGGDLGVGAGTAANFETAGKLATASASASQYAQSGSRERRDSVRSEGHLKNIKASADNNAVKAAELIPIKSDIVGFVQDRVTHELQVEVSKGMVTEQFAKDVAGL